MNSLSDLFRAIDIAAALVIIVGVSFLFIFRKDIRKLKRH